MVLSAKLEQFGVGIAKIGKSGAGTTGNEAGSAGETARGSGAARQFTSRLESQYPAAVICLRNDLDELLTCFRYKCRDQRKAVRTTNAIERRFREVRRRTRPMGTFQDITSMDRILYAVFTHENKSQGVSTPFLLTQNN